MAEYKIGGLVRSLAGHDKDEVFIIIKEDALYVYLADGRLRPLDKAKRKKKKHVQPINVVDERLQNKLTSGGHVTDEELKFFIKTYHHLDQENPGR